METEKIENRIAVRVYLPDEISSFIKGVKDKNNVSYPNQETQSPHVTIYACKFDQSKFLKLVEQVKNLNLKPFSVKLGSIEVAELNKGNDNLFASIGFADEADLRNIHERVLEVANGLRGDLIREKDLERYRRGVYSEELFSFIKQYGYEHVKENFHPHITLGAVDRDDFAKIDEMRTELKRLSGKEVLIDALHVVLSTKLVPSEKKLKDSEVIKISLKN